MSMRPLPPVIASDVQLFLAFDYGEKRTGVASGNRLTRSATPLGHDRRARGREVASDCPIPERLVATGRRDWGATAPRQAPTTRTRLRRKSLADKSRVVLP